MLLSRREFLARVWPLPFTPLLMGHHRPGHDGGPPTPSETVGYARVSFVALEIPASDASEPSPSGGWGADPWGQFEWGN